MKLKKYLPRVLIGLSILLVLTVVVTTVMAKPDDNIICNGVFINTVDVGGMTEAQAEEAVDQYINDLRERKVKILVDTHEIDVTFDELGYECDVKDSIKEALSLGKSGNFIKRYKEMKDLENENKILPLEITVDKNAVKKVVEEKCTEFDVKAKNAKLKRENGKFIVTEDRTGRTVVVDETIEKIRTELSSKKLDSDEDVVIEAIVREDEPKHTSEKVALCKDVLGTFSTTYASSSASRANNLANGAKKINGSVVWPGETFSTGKALNPITVENGYSIAGAYQSGQVIDSIGGGVCQVSTTLYNALLRAELEIVERANHSMIVGYVEPAMDAAIAGTYKDLKFKNNTDVPVYIEATTQGRTITFTIYGHETRDTENRKVEFKSEVLQVINPTGEKITEDPTLPNTYRRVTQSAHRGYKAKLWKIVYENGVEVSREQVNYSSYAAEPAYVTVGTRDTKKEEEEKKKKEEEKKKKEEEQKKKEEEEKKKEEEKEKKEEEIDKKPEKTPTPTKKPTPTPAPTKAPEEVEDPEETDLEE